jgi:OmpA-OmpF porin, OOP family
LKKDRKSLFHLSLSLLLAGMTSPSWATSPGPYFGLQLGWGRLNQGKFIARHMNRLVSNVAPDTSVHNVFFSDTGRGGRIFLGYQFNRFFAAEVGYYRFSELNFDASMTTDIPLFDFNIALGLATHVKVRTDAYDLVAKGMLPLTDAFSFYAKAGLVALNSEGTAVVTAKTPVADVSLYAAPSVNIIYPIVGLGMNYDVTPKLSIDLSVIRIQQVNRNLYPSIDFAAIGMMYHFS